MAAQNAVAHNSGDNKNNNSRHPYYRDPPNQHHQRNRYHAEEPSHHHDEEEDDDFMMRFVNGPCQGMFPDDVHNPCVTMLPACQVSLDQQLDVFTHCRQPLAFLSFFREHANPQGDTVGVEVLPAGAYVLPTFCEYCGAPNTAQCDPATCGRPRLYFQKKRPPFCKPDPQKWDPITDHYIPPPEPSPLPIAPSPVPGASDSTSPPTTTTSWVAGLFGRSRSPPPPGT